MAFDLITGKDKYFDCDMYGKPEERKVVILFSEGKERILVRIMGYLQENNLTLKDIKGKLFLLDFSKYVDIVKDTRLINQNTVIALEKSLKRYKTDFSMIIIDTLNGFYGAKENSADDMALFFSNIEAHLAVPFNSNVVIIHHTGLASQNGNNIEEMRARGSTAFKGRLDSLIICKGKIVEGLEVYNDKQRDGENGKKLFIKSKIVPVKAIPLNSKGKPTTASVVDKSVDCSQVKNGMTLTESESQKEKLKDKAKSSKRWLEGLMSRREIPFEYENTATRKGYKFYSKDLITIMESDLDFKEKQISKELNPTEHNRTIGSLVNAGILDSEKLGRKDYVYWTVDNIHYRDNSGLWFISSEKMYKSEEKDRQRLLDEMNDSTEERTLFDTEE